MLNVHLTSCQIKYVINTKGDWLGKLNHRQNLHMCVVCRFLQALLKMRTFILFWQGRAVISKSSY